MNNEVDTELFIVLQATGSMDKGILTVHTYHAGEIWNIDPTDGPVIGIFNPIDESIDEIYDQQFKIWAAYQPEIEEEIFSTCPGCGSLMSNEECPCCDGHGKLNDTAAYFINGETALGDLYGG